LWLFSRFFTICPSQPTVSSNFPKPICTSSARTPAVLASSRIPVFCHPSNIEAIISKPSAQLVLRIIGSQHLVLSMTFT